jgi:alpha-glucosidase (family GH31 glycosyl hydrolase)
MRPLVWHHQEDPVAAACGDQFLLGRSLMVAPVLRQGAVARSVYLPEGTWFDFWNGRRHRGGQHIVSEAPLHRLPLFVRGGSIVPMGALRQHTGGPPDGTVNLHLWPAGRSELAWYEDDGRSMQHVDGSFHSRPIGWDGRSLSFGPCEGDLASHVKSWRMVLRCSKRPLKPHRSWKHVRCDAESRIQSFELSNRRQPRSLPLT